MIFRLDINKTKVSFGEIATAISQAGGDLVAIDVIHATKDITTRDITVNLSEAGTEHLLQALERLPGVHVVNTSDSAFLAHLGGKVKKYKH